MTRDEDKQVKECCQVLAIRVALRATIERIDIIVRDLEAMKHEWQRAYEEETGRPYKELKPSPPPFLDAEAGEHR